MRGSILVITILLQGFALFSVEVSGRVVQAEDKSVTVSKKGVQQPPADPTDDTGYQSSETCDQYDEELTGEEDTEFYDWLAENQDAIVAAAQEALDQADCGSTAESSVALSQTVGSGKSEIARSGLAPKKDVVQAQPKKKCGFLKWLKKWLRDPIFGAPIIPGIDLIPAMDDDGVVSFQATCTQ